METDYTFIIELWNFCYFFINIIIFIIFYFIIIIFIIIFSFVNFLFYIQSLLKLFDAQKNSIFTNNIRNVGKTT